MLFIALFALLSVGIETVGKKILLVEKIEGKKNTAGRRNREKKKEILLVEKIEKKKKTLLGKMPPLPSELPGTPAAPPAGMARGVRSLRRRPPRDPSAHARRPSRHAPPRPAPRRTRARRAQARGSRPPARIRLPDAPPSEVRSCPGMEPPKVEKFSTADRGNGLRALAPLRPGELLFRSDPLAYTVSKGSRGVVCDRCLLGYVRSASPTRCRRGGPGAAVPSPELLLSGGSRGRAWRAGSAGHPSGCLAGLGRTPGSVPAALTPTRRGLRRELGEQGSRLQGERWVGVSSLGSKKCVSGATGVLSVAVGSTQSAGCGFGVRRPGSGCGEQRWQRQAPLRLGEDLGAGGGGAGAWVLRGHFLGCSLCCLQVHGASSAALGEQRRETALMSVRRQG